MCWCIESQSIHLINIFVLIRIFAGGCALYGHSCYGGHGKRSEIDALPVESASIPSEKLFQTDSKEAMVGFHRLQAAQLNKYQNHLPKELPSLS